LTISLKRFSKNQKQQDLQRLLVAIIESRVPIFINYLKQTRNNKTQTKSKPITKQKSL